MTTTELTVEQKRVKIAVACGIENAERLLPYYENARPLVPDYFTDLNACHEMEKALNHNERDKYLFLLVDEVCPNKPSGETPLQIEAREAICATAAQRAEAFGRTLALW